MGHVLSYSADVGVSAARGLAGSGIDLLGRIVQDDHARCLSEDVASAVCGQLLFGFDVDRLAMAGMHGNAHSSGRKANIIVPHDFPGLIEHFKLFGGIAG